MIFTDKVCWVTGASSGIGEAIVYQLATKGAKLVISARRLDELEKVKIKCAELGNKNVQVVAIDLSDQESISAAFRAVKNVHQRVDYLFNNGGLSQRGLVSDSESIEADRKIMEVNFFGTIALTKKVLTLMLNNGFGHFVVTSSIVGKFGFPLRSTYSASKHALHGYFESLAIENFNNNISVSMVLPGRIATSLSLGALNAEGKVHGEMDEGLAAGMDVNECAKQIVKGVALKKREILVGGKEIMMVHFRRFVPALFYKLAARIKPT
ncbi:MAG: SDR family NAD(P)-dependent oxidoreductase [Flavobacteriales bacterium]|nr:SDR family NAD(P)-dependent oxidoreductase [Flavobacteriales bacterium]